MPTEEDIANGRRVTHVTVDQAMQGCERPSESGDHRHRTRHVTTS